MQIKSLLIALGLTLTLGLSGITTSTIASNCSEHASADEGDNTTYAASTVY